MVNLIYRAIVLEEDFSRSFGKIQVISSLLGKQLVMPH